MKISFRTVDLNRDSSGFTFSTNFLRRAYLLD